MLYLMQVGIDWQVPIWSILVVLAGAIAAFFTLRTQMVEHEKQDNTRFDSVNNMMVEMRDDIKELLRHSYAKDKR